MSILNPKEVDALIESSKIDLKKENTKDLLKKGENLKKIAITSKNTLSARKIQSQFENKYPALELVLKKFIDYLEKNFQAKFFSKTAIYYQYTQEEKLEKIKELKEHPQNYFLYSYQPTPLKGVLMTIFNISLLDNLFAILKEKPEKGDYKKSLVNLGKLVEDQWHKAWRNLYPLYTHFNFASSFNDLSKNWKKMDAILFSFSFVLNKQEYPFLITFSRDLLTQLTKTKISLTSFLNPKEQRKAFLENLIKRKIRVSCYLDSYKMTLSDLLGLEKGDIVLINFKKNDTIFFSVEEEKKFIGKFFSYQQKKAIRLIKLLD